MDQIDFNSSIFDEGNQTHPVQVAFPFPDGGLIPDINCIIHCLRKCKSFMMLIKSRRFKYSGQFCKRLSQTFEFLDSFEEKKSSGVKCNVISDETNQMWQNTLQNLIRCCNEEPGALNSYGNPFVFLADLIVNLERESIQGKICHISNPFIAKTHTTRSCLKCKVVNIVSPLILKSFYVVIGFENMRDHLKE